MTSLRPSTTRPSPTAQNSTKSDLMSCRSDTPLLHTAEKLHMKPVVAMAYSPAHDVVISADQGGLVEYWTGNGEPAANVAFKSKLDTDLFEFAKNKTRPLNLTVSPGGKFLAAFSADKKVQLNFKFQIIFDITYL